MIITNIKYNMKDYVRDDKRQKSSRLHVSSAAIGGRFPKLFLPAEYSGFHLKMFPPPNWRPPLELCFGGRIYWMPPPIGRRMPLGATVRRYFGGKLIWKLPTVASASRLAAATRSFIWRQNVLEATANREAKAIDGRC